jgi:hypothetical protein
VSCNYWGFSCFLDFSWADETGVRSGDVPVTYTVRVIVIPRVRKYKTSMVADILETSSTCMKKEYLGIKDSGK